MSELDSYLRGWHRRWEERQQADAASARQARRIAEALARTLLQRYGARRVVLVGSLARGEFVAGSDIDLAAEGIPPRGSSVPVPISKPRRAGCTST